MSRQPREAAERRGCDIEHTQPRRVNGQYVPVVLEAAAA